MRVALCQMHSGDDVAANNDAAEASLREAAAGGADLAALPEYFGYLGPSARRRELAEPVPGPATDRVARIARELGIWVLGGTVLELDDDRVYDTSLLFDRTGEIVASYRKIHLYDVDLPGQVLTIWDTKFFKSRLVPIGTQLCQALDRYAGQRGQPPSTSGPTAFFRTTTDLPISLAQLEAAFVRLRTHAGIERPATDRWQPRLHDMRHSFAVHQLVSWYRAGVDVHTRLPLLATYLGHVNLAGTQKYLTMTPELLGEAACRFERYADASMEVPHA